MQNRITAVFAVLCLVAAAMLFGCSKAGIYPVKGEVTTPGLPAIFEAGTDWHLPYNPDNKVKGTTLHISSKGDVVVKKEGKIIPSRIENNEIVLDGVLKGCSIYAKNWQTAGFVYIKTQMGKKKEDLGLFVKYVEKTVTVKEHI